MSTTEDDEQDLTRKERREQARAQRKALEEAEAASAQRRKRLIQLGGAAAVVVVAIVIILVATGGSSSKPTLPPSGKPSPEAKKVDALLANIPQSGLTLGSNSAPVTLQYFGDLECPVCKEFTLGALEKLIPKYVRPGKLRIEYRNLETATRDPETFRTQQIAAMSAGKQNKGWNYIELFYHLQGEEDTEYVTEEYLEGLAQQIPGLNLATWKSDRNNPEFTNTITTDAQLANNNSFTGTPSFLIGGTGGAASKLSYSSLSDPSSFEAAINKLIKT